MPSITWIMWLHSMRILLEIRWFFTKAGWCFIVIFGRIFFQPICKYFGEQFVKNITQANRTIFMNKFRIYDFRNESNESVVDRMGKSTWVNPREDRTNHIMINYLPKMLIKKWRHPIGSRAFSGAICFKVVTTSHSKKSPVNILFISSKITWET